MVGVWLSVQQCSELARLVALLAASEVGEAL